MALAEALLRRWEDMGFEKTVMAIVREALVVLNVSRLSARCSDALEAGRLGQRSVVWMARRGQSTPLRR